jgi:hypothetical protein
MKLLYTHVDLIGFLSFEAPAGRSLDGQDKAHRLLVICNGDVSTVSWVSALMFNDPMDNEQHCATVSNLVVKGIPSPGPVSRQGGGGGRPAHTYNPYFEIQVKLGKPKLVAGRPRKHLDLLRKGAETDICIITVVHAHVSPLIDRNYVIAFAELLQVHNFDGPTCRLESPRLP